MAWRGSNIDKPPVTPTGQLPQINSTPEYTYAGPGGDQLKYSAQSSAPLVNAGTEEIGIFLQAFGVADSLQDRNPQVHKQPSPYYWFCTGHIGLYAPRLPTIRPQNAEKRRQIRP